MLPIARYTRIDPEPSPGRHRQRAASLEWDADGLRGRLGLRRINIPFADAILQVSRVVGEPPPRWPRRRRTAPLVALTLKPSEAPPITLTARAESRDQATGLAPMFGDGVCLPLKVWLAILQTARAADATLARWHVLDACDAPDGVAVCVGGVSALLRRVGARALYLLTALLGVGYLFAHAHVLGWGDAPLFALMIAPAPALGVLCASRRAVHRRIGWSRTRDALEPLFWPVAALWTAAAARGWFQIFFEGAQRAGGFDLALLVVALNIAGVALATWPSGASLRLDAAGLSLEGPGARRFAPWGDARATRDLVSAPSFASLWRSDTLRQLCLRFADAPETLAARLRRWPLEDARDLAPTGVALHPLGESRHEVPLALLWVGVLATLAAVVSSPTETRLWPLLAGLIIAAGALSSWRQRTLLDPTAGLLLWETHWMGRRWRCGFALEHLALLEPRGGLLPHVHARTHGLDDRAPASLRLGACASPSEALNLTHELRRALGVDEAPTPRRLEVDPLTSS